MLRVKTINFAELATAFSGNAQTDSHYKRLQRFFRHYAIDYAEIAQAVVALMAIPEPWVLSLDRTQWHFGEHTFNILMLGVVHEGVAFPVVWCLLDTPGNSNIDERIDLFNQFLERFGERSLDCLTADREYIGKDWFSYLLQEPRTPFRIRIRHNHILGKGRLTSSGQQRLSITSARAAAGAPTQTTIVGALALHRGTALGRWNPAGGCNSECS